MKRGLKDFSPFVMLSPIACYNRYPDEKGTESGVFIAIHLITKCYNRYPDEKGTESQIDRGCRSPRQSYNRYPDEKGTESSPSSILTLCLSMLQPLPR